MQPNTEQDAEEWPACALPLGVVSPVLFDSNADPIHRTRADFTAAFIQPLRLEIKVRRRAGLVRCRDALADLSTQTGPARLTWTLLLIHSNSASSRRAQSGSSPSIFIRRSLGCSPACTMETSTSGTTRTRRALGTRLSTLVPTEALTLSLLAWPARIALELNTTGSRQNV